MDAWVLMVGYCTQWSIGVHLTAKPRFPMILYDFVGYHVLSSRKICPRHNSAPGRVLDVRTLKSHAIVWAGWWYCNHHANAVNVYMEGSLHRLFQIDINLVVSDLASSTNPQLSTMDCRLQDIGARLNFVKICPNPSSLYNLYTIYLIYPSSQRPHFKTSSHPQGFPVLPDESVTELQNALEPGTHGQRGHQPWQDRTGDGLCKFGGWYGLRRGIYQARSFLTFCHSFTPLCIDRSRTLGWIDSLGTEHLADGFSHVPPWWKEVIRNRTCSVSKSSLNSAKS